MTPQNPFRYFYDSGSDGLNESNIIDYESDFLNVAFISSPGKSLSYLFNDSSHLDPPGGLMYKDFMEEQEKANDQKVPKLTGNKYRLEISSQVNHLKTASESPLENELRQHSVLNSAYIDVSEGHLGSSGNRNPILRSESTEKEMRKMESLEIHGATNSLKKSEERPDCIFSSTCVNEFEKAPEKYDWCNIAKRSVLEMDDGTETVELEIKVPVSLSDHVYHRLSTIPEKDSVFMEDSDESQMNFKFLKANDNIEFTIHSKTPSYFPVNVMQNADIEKLLLEPGITEEPDLTLISTEEPDLTLISTEEPDLTLISTNFNSISRISEKTSENGHSNGYYEIKRFSNADSPSMISFLKHEMSSMEDSFEE